MVLAATGADLVILNSGTFRSDQVHPAGDFTMRDLVNIVPMRDPLAVLKVTGNLYLLNLSYKLNISPLFMAHIIFVFSVITIKPAVT